MTTLVSSARIDRSILVIRGQRVMLDADLAVLYGVQVRVLNQAVRRNIARFPPDFMVQLTAEEHQALRSQSVILKKGRGQHRKYFPLAFTEQGVAMLSSVLRSERAIRVNIEIMRAFVRMRQLVATRADLRRRIDDLEKKYDAQLKVVFDAIRKLMEPVQRPRTRIGFQAEGG